jgi:Na+/proline symporter
VFCSLAIILSYLGWVAAQITALGLVFSVLTDGAMSETAGMIVGTLAVLIYVVVGGFLAVAWTDFIQMIVLGDRPHDHRDLRGDWPAAPTRCSR